MFLHKVDAEDSGDLYTGFGGNLFEGFAADDEEVSLASVRSDFVGHLADRRHDSVAI